MAKTELEVFRLGISTPIHLLVTEYFEILPIHADTKDAAEKLFWDIPVGEPLSLQLTMYKHPEYKWCVTGFGKGV